MPRRNRRDRSLEGSAAPPGRPRSDAPLWALAPGLDVRRVNGDKPYVCPGCEHPIRAGLEHFVVVPQDDPDGRRHWHVACWRTELRRAGRG